MMAVVELWMILSAVVVLLLTIAYTKTPRHLPPGPKGLPIIGYLHKFSGNYELHKTLNVLRQQYGDIFSLFLGSHVAIVLSGSDVIREAFISKAKYFSSRPDWFFLTKHMVQQKGILWSQSWSNVRRFTQIALKDFGIGSQTIEERIQTEAEYLCAEFSASAGQAYDPQWAARNALSNVICSIVFGKRFDYDDPEFRDLMERMNFYVKMNVMFSFPNFIPWTIIMWFFGGARTAIANKTAIENFITSRVKEHKLDYDPENIRDFVDLYIQHEAKTENQVDLITDKGILTVVMELFFAGTESTSTTLLWFILFMILHPDVQKKCRDEIHQVIGSSRMARKSDMGTLPYLEATMMESQRLGSTAPYTIPHMVSETVQFHGYTLPKGAMVIADLYSTMLDPKVFPEPEKFKSERWLNGNGQTQTIPQFMPFGAGKRMCIGEQLARLELFILSATLLQRFELQMVDPTNPPTTEPHSGITLMAKPFQLKVIRL